MESTVRNVKDIQGGERRWLETTLGQQLQDNQQVFIMVLTPDVEPDEVTRRKAGKSIDAILDQAEQNATAQGVTAEEADSAVDEAMEHVRRET